MTKENEIIYERIDNRKIEQIIGKACIDDQFRESLYSNPEKIANMYKLPDKLFIALKKLDRKILEEFATNLDANVLKNVAEIIFCG